MPGGRGWFGLYSGKFFNGGQVLLAEAPYDRIPVFVREGSIIPFGPGLEYTSQKAADTISLFVYTGKNASFDLYEDEGTNYNYEKGAFSIITFRYDEKKKTLTINERKGEFPGMLRKRVFNIIWITQGKPRILDFDQSPDAQLVYEGKQKIIRKK